MLCLGAILTQVCDLNFLLSAVYLSDIVLCQIAINHTQIGSIWLISADSFLIENPSEITISYGHNAA